MSSRQENSAGADARHELAARPERPHRHEDAMRRYLGAAFYGETRRAREALRDEDARPVDEPAPEVRTRPRRR
jgi:hypothetical protein